MPSRHTEKVPVVKDRHMLAPSDIPQPPSAGMKRGTKMRDVSTSNNTRKSNHSRGSRGPQGRDAEHRSIGNRVSGTSNNRGSSKVGGLGGGARVSASNSIGRQPGYQDDDRSIGGSNNKYR